MFKIWAKLYKKEKIVGSIIFEHQEKFNRDKFFSYLTKICQTLDIVVPVVMNSHIDHFINFNNCRFLARDFVDKINFTKLVLESIPIDK
ncbi:MAG: hypothetical protein FWE03_02765 [Firmicutes bacterium]|nr:hypothetical protein [Bacillota bacterium]